MALSTSRTVLTQTGINTFLNYDIGGLNSAGIATFSNFKTGTTDVHSVGVNAATIVVGSAVTSNSDGIEVTGIVTATSFVGSGSGLTGVASTDPSNVQATWKLGGGSGSGFTFTGPGQDGSEGNPDIYLVRGQRYLFDNTVLAGNHPFEFRNAANTADYTDGVSGAQNGLQYLNVQHDAPARLKYRCTIHTTSMLGDIYIIGGPEVISGVVTATTFVGNLTGTASANAVLTGSTNDQLVTVTGANAITGESALTYSGNILKNEVSDASGLTAHILVNNSESSAGVSLLGSGSSFSSGGWAPVTDAGIIRSSAGATNGLVLQAASGNLLFHVDTTERVRIDSNGKLTMSSGTVELESHMIRVGNRTTSQINAGVSTSTGSVTLNTSNNNLLYYANAQWNTVKRIGNDGSTQTLAARSAKALLDEGFTSNGVYWLDMHGA